MKTQPYTTQTITQEQQSSLNNELAHPPFRSLLQRFTPINLAQMKNVALLRRVDTKYVLSAQQLYRALTQLSNLYYVLDINGQRVHQYQTTYFDTPNFALYRQHHDGRRNRYKVRTRAYLDSGQAFLEVKRKTNKNMTVKKRLPTAEPNTCSGAEAENFLRSYFPYDSADLECKLHNTFQRITLVSKHNLERLTLDMNVRFGRAGAQGALPNIAIAEIKQEGFSLRSDFIGQMRTLGAHPQGFSKYCMGVAQLYAQIKHNNFKPQQLYIDKIMRTQKRNLS